VISGIARPGDNQPAFPQDAPAPTRSCSTTVTCPLRPRRNHAIDTLEIPVPTTTAPRGVMSPPSSTMATSDTLLVPRRWAPQPRVSL
jgi:hypothetical protein